MSIRLTRNNWAWRRDKVRIGIDEWKSDRDLTKGPIKPWENVKETEKTKSSVNQAHITISNEGYIMDQKGGSNSDMKENTDQTQMDTTLESYVEESIVVPNQRRTNSNSTIRRSMWKIKKSIRLGCSSLSNSIFDNGIHNCNKLF